jgi:bifunctional non-homologous end joining protein LigD
MAQLRTYRAKRDFAKTAEPRGRVGPGRSKSLRFVIQRHDATRLHYDVRLELDGVYKSWAVTKVPSLDPATKRLAVEVEDHPLDYGTFEGTIPEGEYGGGTVQLWDRGTWSPHGENPAADLKKGRLTFDLDGERMHGGWALIRMRADPAKPGRKVRNNWLLIKERDAAAQPGEPDMLLSEDTSVKTGRTLDEIAGSKRSKVWHSSRAAKSAGPKTVAPSPKSTIAAAPKRAALMGSKPAARVENAVAGITISKPDKELWPGIGITKLDLAQYYEMAAERMLPHIRRRPISMVRLPDGLNGQRFFQRHVLAGFKAAVPIKARGVKEPYHAIDSVEGLVQLAQAAVMEIHPWGCKENDPETPERIIIDLDPDPELSCERVMDAAKEVRDALELCGFTPFVKTTGGKGMHVVVAIKGTPKKQATWPDAKDFAHQLVERVAAGATERYTTNMSKAKRGGKIFLDYLRNDRMATAIGPWSPRARPGATIATPVAWKDLRKAFDPSKLTIETAAPLLRRADPWKDLAASAISLDGARKKLTSL